MLHWIWLAWFIHFLVLTANDEMLVVVGIQNCFRGRPSTTQACWRKCWQARPVSVWKRTKRQDIVIVMPILQWWSSVSLLFFNRFVFINTCVFFQFHSGCFDSHLCCLVCEESAVDNALKDLQNHVQLGMHLLWQSCSNPWSYSRVDFCWLLWPFLWWIQHAQSWRRSRGCWMKQMESCMKIWALGWVTLFWLKGLELLRILHKQLILEKEWISHKERILGKEPEVMNRHVPIHSVKLGPHCPKRGFLNLWLELELGICGLNKALCTDDGSHCAVLHTGNLPKDQSAAVVYTRLCDHYGSHLWHATTGLHHAGLAFS